jgi:hypothetical protein
MLHACDNGSSSNDNDCSEINGSCSHGDSKGEDDGNGSVTAAMVAGGKAELVVELA